MGGVGIKIIPLLVLILAACTNPITPTPTDFTRSPTVTATASATVSPSPTRTPVPSSTPTATATIAAGTLTPAPTATPNPLMAWSIEALAARTYGEGDLLVRETLPPTGPYYRYLVEYPSDGLTVTGLLNVPTYGEPPYPVIIVLHGYIHPDDYEPGLDSRYLGDEYALHGYAVLMPDFRGYNGAAGSGNPMRMPYVIDTLNAIESLDTLDVLDQARVGLIGHSMGGGVAAGVAVISDRVDAVVLYGAMNGDQAANYHHIRETFSPGWADWSAGQWGTPESNPDGFAAISASTYYDRIRVPVQIHHGTADDQVPYAWAVEMTGAMSAAGVDVTLYPYEDGPHTFRADPLARLLTETLAFFDAEVRGDTLTP